MAIFHFPQFQHEPFWQYLSRLNDYRAQYMLSMYKKWEICDVVLEGITHETWATLESLCHGDLCLLNADDMWDLFESLASYQWQFECASEALYTLPHLPMIYPLNLHVWINLEMLVITILSLLLMPVLVANLLTVMWILVPHIMCYMTHVIDLLS